MDSVLIKNNIQKYREDNGINQQQMASELEIDRTYLSKLENQKFSPGTGLMAKICKYFNKQLGEVFYIE
jgi:putative transcriptional regulator